MSDSYDEIEAYI